MLFRQLFDHETCTFTYLLADTDTREAIIIDPVDMQLERDIGLIRELGLSLKYGFDTHVHADHITSLGRLRELSGCKIGLSAHANVACADIQLHEGDSFAFGAYRIGVLETPGHTDGCLSFLCDGMVMTGDALFIRGCGRTDFQQGDAARLYHSITSKLFTLPDETRVYPGHDYKGMTVSTIGEERALNPRLTLDQDAFVVLMASLNLPAPKRILDAVPANMACGMPE